MKEIISKEEFEAPLIEGMTKIAGIVKRTLGPGGLPIVIQRVGQQLNGDPLGPKITKDGVSVAQECADSDPKVDLVIQAVKAICQKTNTKVGDGPQPLTAKVLTPTGYTTMGQLEIGQEICGSNGTIQKVLGVFPKGKKQVYKVSFSGGRETKCCAEHLWEVRDKNGKLQILPTSELIKDYKKTENNFNNYKYYTPTSIVNMQSDTKNMPIDPYTLGVLLGDGSLSGDLREPITICLGENKEHIISKLNFPEGFSISKYLYADRNSFKLRIKGRCSKNNKSLQDYLQSLNLLGTKSASKFIPKQYLYASVEDRKALLQGLHDTDGYKNVRGLYEFSTISKQLGQDYLFLMRSLGFQTKEVIHSRDNDPNSYSETPIFRYCGRKGFKNGLKIIKIEATNEYEEMQCIKVSNPDSLYVTDDLIFTHNTTTAVVLGEALLFESLKILRDNLTINPQILREQIEAAAEEVKTQLQEIAIPVNTQERISQVATISANGDTSIGEIIGKAYTEVGQEGVITVEEGASLNTTLTVVEGYQINKGAELRDQFFNYRNQTCFQAENPVVLIYDGEIQNHLELMPVLKALEVVVRSKQMALPPIVVLANYFSPAVLTYMLFLKAESGINIVPVCGPNTTYVRTGYYDDLAVLLKANRLGNGKPSLLEAKPSDLGTCSKVVVDRHTTTFYGFGNTEEAILARVEHIRGLKEAAESPYDLQILNERMAALTQGIAKISVGGATEMEIKERYDRIEDALNAAKAAISEGIIPGGGSTLFRIANKLPIKNFGYAILKEALRTPFQQILTNIGIDYKEPGQKILVNSDLVYNARSKDVEHYEESGVVDPVKVTRTALENAVSIATLLSTAGGGIIIKPIKGAPE